MENTEHSLSDTLHPAARSARAPRVNLLLISRSDTWKRAVDGAVARLGGRSAVARGGKDAVTRLAGMSPRYSHLLVEPDDAEGLFDEIADLAAAASASADILLLGEKQRHRPRLRAIPDATAGSVLEALMADRPQPAGQSIDLDELHAALDGARIDTRYQPMIRIADRKPVGLEALARLNHPEHGSVLPDRFMPLIEDAGLADRLTELVYSRALSDMRHGAFAVRRLRMSVNFPLDVLLRAECIQHLEACRTAAGIEAGRIVVELTESRPVKDVEALRVSLQTLRELGYGAAIDDVGPAVPVLEPLLPLPFTSLKLDKNVVQQVNSSADSRAFLRHVIGRAKLHGLSVVAEGVETAEIWTAMKELGADEVQGFLASRPLPLAAIPVWLDHWNNPAPTF